MKIKFVELVNIPLKSLKSNPHALKRLWKRRGLIDNKGYIDLRSAITEIQGIGVEEFMKNPQNFILLNHYCQKYKIPFSTAREMLRKGVLRGIKLVGRVFVKDEPPAIPQRPSVFLPPQSIEEVESKVTLSTLGKPIALLELPQQTGKRYGQGIKSFIKAMKEKGRIFLIGKRCYLLINATPLSLDDIKKLYKPSELIIPPLKGKEITWDDVKQA